MRRLLFLLGLILAAPAAGQAPPGEITAVLGDTTLHLPLPTGYCAIDRARPGEAALFDGQATALAPMNELLGMAVACDELTASRDQNIPFSHYLEFMATEPGGQPIRRRNAERSTYLAELARRIQPLDSTAIAHLTQQAPTQPSGVATSVQRVGLVGQDEAAAYLGGVASYNDTVVANVAALTLAGGWALSCNFYDNKPDAGTTASLLAAAKAEARAMIAANAGSDAPAPAVTETSDKSWIVALAAAVALLGVTGVTYLRRRR
jgi:hypothetical protein